MIFRFFRLDKYKQSTLSSQGSWHDVQRYSLIVIYALLMAILKTYLLFFWQFCTQCVQHIIRVRKLVRIWRKYWIGKIWKLFGKCDTDIGKCIAFLESLFYFEFGVKLVQVEPGLARMESSEFMKSAEFAKLVEPPRTNIIR